MPHVRGRGELISRGEGGQAIVFMVIAILAMIMSVGLAIDAGQLFFARRHMQEASDAAAFAAAVTLYLNGSDSAAESAARSDATSNGYTQGVNSATVTYRRGPLSGAYAGNTAYVEITISQPVRTTLVPAQASLTTVAVRSVAGSVPVPSEWSVITLHRAMSHELDWGSSGDLNISGAGIMIDSSNPNAGYHGGSGNINFSPGATYNTRIVGANVGSFPNLQTYQSAVADPFAGTPKPETVGLPTFTSLPDDPLQPGVYDGVTIDQNRTLMPGIYIFKKSSIVDGSGGPPTITGTNVMIWMGAHQYPANSADCGQINVTGGSITLSAPDSGTYKGFAIVQEPLCSQPMSFGGPASLNITGTIYAPGAEFRLLANATATVSQVVPQSLTGAASATLTVNFDPTLTARGLVPALAE